VTDAANEVGLKQLSRPGLDLGVAVGGRLPASLTPHEREVLVRHFAVLTPENCMKPAPIHPEEARYDFAMADAFVRFAGEHGLGVVGHTLVWHSQCPDWFFEAGGAPASRAQVLARMEAHIHTVVGRYRGKIQGWDVVNEAITDAGEYLRETRWLKSIGQEFLEHAFRFAQAADPGVELYYNDYNIERRDKLARTLRLLDQLQKSGVRLDGVGIQGHWQLDKVPYDEIAEAIEQYAARGLKVMFTELDIDVLDRLDSGADVSAQRAHPLPDLYPAGCPDDVLQRQAEQYGRLFELFERYPSAVTRATFWGMADGMSWLNYWPGKRTNYPLLFDRESRPKPAFHAVAQALRGRA
jgi:endo-1,4-beta-xylanase